MYGEKSNDSLVVEVANKPVKELILLKSISNESKRWVLKWKDEFTVLSTNNWTPLDDANGYRNRDQQYKPENVRIENGKLKINILKEKSGKFNHTSGAIVTKDKVHFQYGKLEISAKLPNGTGLIPAIWMWPATGKQFPEIDIAEMIGQNPTELWNVVHDQKNGEYAREFNMTITPDLTKDYHLYGIEWTPEKMVYTLDGKAIFIGKELVPKEEMYLYINTGVGGNWVGEPDEYTTFPNAMLIDYVRYYVREET